MDDHNLQGHEFRPPEEASERRIAARQLRNQWYRELITETLREQTEWIDREDLISEIVALHPEVRKHELERCYSFMTLNTEIASKRDIVDGDKVVCRWIAEDLRGEAKSLVQEAWHRVHEMVDSYQAIGAPAPTAFGKNLAAVRSAARLTHEEVAELLDQKMSAKHIQAVEEGQMSIPTRKTIKYLAAALGDDNDDLIAAAGIVPRYVRRLIALSRGARLFLKIAQRFTEDRWEELIAQVQKEHHSGYIPNPSDAPAIPPKGGTDEVTPR